MENKRTFFKNIDRNLSKTLEDAARDLYALSDLKEDILNCEALKNNEKGLFESKINSLLKDCHALRGDLQGIKDFVYKYDETI